MVNCVATCSWFHAHCDCWQLLTLYVVLTNNPEEDFRVVALWLLLVQAAILPTCLWLFNWRYRQGLKHFMQAFLGAGPYFYPGKHSVLT